MQSFRDVLLVMFSLLFLSSCGGGGGGSSDSSTSTNEVTGKVVDGYLNAATIFLDINRNNILDADEPFTKTDFDGSYSLKIPKDVNNSVNLVVFGGVDIDTDDNFTLVLKSNLSYSVDGESYITPVTTLVSQLLDADQTLNLNEAVDIVASFLDINSSDCAKDPVALYHSGSTQLYYKNRQLLELIKLMKQESDVSIDIYQFAFEAMGLLLQKAKEGKKLDEIDTLTLNNKVFNISDLNEIAHNNIRFDKPVLPEDKYKNIEVDNQIVTYTLEEFNQISSDNGMIKMSKFFYKNLPTSLDIMTEASSFENSSNILKGFYKDGNVSYSLTDDGVILIETQEENLSIEAPALIYGFTDINASIAEYEAAAGESITRAEYILKYGHNYITYRGGIKHKHYILFSLLTRDKVDDYKKSHFFNLIIDTENKRVEILDDIAVNLTYGNKAYSFYYFVASYNDKVILKNYSQNDNDLTQAVSLEFAHVIEDENHHFSLEKFGRTQNTSPELFDSNTNSRYGKGNIYLYIDDFNSDGKQELFAKVGTSFVQTGTELVNDIPYGEYTYVYYVSGEYDIPVDGYRLTNNSNAPLFANNFNEIYTKDKSSHKTILAYNFDFDKKLFQLFGLDNYYKTGNYTGNPYFVKNDSYAEISTNRDNNRVWESKTLQAYEISILSYEIDISTSMFLIEKDNEGDTNSYTMLRNFNFDTLDENTLLELPDSTGVGSCTTNYPGWLQNEPQLVGECQVAYYYACNKEIYENQYPEKVSEFNFRIKTYCDILEDWKEHMTDGSNPREICGACDGYPNFVN